MPRRFRRDLHFASPASPIDSERIPILKVGALGTYNSLGLAKAKGASFLLASTREVYGDPLVHPQHDECWGNVNPIGVRVVYDEAKRYAESITAAYHRHHHLETRIACIFEEFKPDALCHQAAQMNVCRSVHEPDFNAEANVVGAIRLLENCVRYGVRKVVFASTSGAIYGEQKEFLATEDHPQYPSSPYGVSKLADERYSGSADSPRPPRGHRGRELQVDRSDRREGGGAAELMAFEVSSFDGHR